jgi:sugar/nucleoside kinase (ribokinase family)
MTPTVVCVGPHIIDVLARPVSEIPAGQGGVLLEEARVTAAGTAAGTAVDLAKLGAEVSSIGAIGDDTAGRLVRMLLQEHGVDASRLAIKPGLQTSTTILPIRANGERPSLHAPGATASLTADDVDWQLIAEADVLHVGGPDALGAFGADVVPGLLRFAKEHGTVTTVDLLRTVVDPELLTMLEAAWPHIDYFLPNDDQARALTGATEVEAAARFMRDRGVGTMIVTMGGAGSYVLGDGVAERIPAFECRVVDTTGCGDAYTAGLIIGLHRGWQVDVAARLGTAAAALVAGGLGSDAGIVDLPGTLAFWRDRADEIGAEPPGLVDVTAKPS